MQILKNLFWENDVFKRAKKLGIKIDSSDGIDYETFCKRVTDAENSLNSKLSLALSIGSFLVSVIAIIISLFK